MVKDIIQDPIKLLSGRHGKTCMKSIGHVLSMFDEVNLSRRQYEVGSDVCKSLYSSCSTLQKQKLNCFPNKEACQNLDFHAEI